MTPLCPKDLNVLNLPRHGMRTPYNRLEESEKEKDLGVVINNRLSPEDHIQEKVRNMHNLLANMRVAFTYIDEEMVKKNNNAMHTSYA